MIEPGWRRTGALVLQQAGVACAKPRAWIIRWTLGTGASAIVLLAARYLSGPQTAPLEEYLRQIAGAVGLAVYLVVLWLCPSITLGALGEKRRGRLDLLAASPLIDIQVFAGLIGARFLSALHVLVGLAPALMIFTWLGGAGEVIQVIQIAACILAAAWLTTSCATHYALRGFREGAVWIKLVVFIAVTPLSSPYPFVISLLALAGGNLASLFVELDGRTLAAMITCSVFPFWALGFSMLDASMEPSSIAAALAVSCLMALGLTRSSLRRFPRWLRESDEEAERKHEDASYWRLRGKATTGCHWLPAEEPSTSSYGRRRLSGIGGWAYAVYKLSRRNAHVVQEVLREDFGAEVLGASLVGLFVLAWVTDLNIEPGAGPSSPGAAAAVLGLVPCLFLSALEGTRSLPPRGTRAREVFLSTPVTGWQVFAGSMLAGFLRFRFALLAVLAMGLVAHRNVDFLRAPAFLLLFGSQLAFAHAIGLWARLIAPSPGSGPALAIVTCVALGLGTAWLWPEGGPPHPLRAWYSTGAAGIALSGGMVAAAAVLLGAAFGAAFRKVEGRR